MDLLTQPGEHAHALAQLVKRQPKVAVATADIVDVSLLLFRTMRQRKKLTVARNVVLITGCKSGLGQKLAAEAMATGSSQSHPTWVL